MATFPWKQQQSPPPDTSYLVFYSRLPLRRSRSIPGFLWHTLRIRRQLARAAGLIGYSLKADLLDKTFWTVSAWIDEASLNQFATAEPHRTIIRKLRPVMAESKFDQISTSAAPPPVGWDVVTERVG